MASYTLFEGEGYCVRVRSSRRIGQATNNSQENRSISGPLNATKTSIRYLGLFFAQRSELGIGYTDRVEVAEVCE